MCPDDSLIKVHLFISFKLSLGFNWVSHVCPHLPWRDCVHSKKMCVCEGWGAHAHTHTQTSGVRWRQQWETWLLSGRRCKQTVGKKATSYIIEGDVKASSLLGCQCQEAEPGWEQRAPPCLPLRWAAIYIVNTHTHTGSFSLSLTPSRPLSYCLALQISPLVSFTHTHTHSFTHRLSFFTLVINAPQRSWGTERWDSSGDKIK